MKTDREKLINWIRNTYVSNSYYTYKATMDETADAVIADMLIDNGVVMREMGEWEGTRCSQCGGSYMNYADADSYPAIGEPKPDFCPNCGADMREGENNG